MTVKLAYLKSGEQVIADIKELVDPNSEKVVSLLFENPYVVVLLTPELLVESNINQLSEVEHRVSYSPWIVFSDDKKIAVNPDWVITVVEPNEWIKSSYMEKMSVDIGNAEVDETLKGPTINESLENFEVVEG
jgi:hypothetical protein